MASWSVRKIGIACAGVVALAAVLMLGLRQHSAHRSQSAAATSESTSQGHKPSPYGEAFRPSTIQDQTFHSPHVVASSTVASSAQPFPVVAPSLMAARLISAPPPAYPLLAKMAHVRGQVTVEAIISSSGTVSAARATDGHRLLRAAAEAAVRQRRYRPYRIGGQPANVSTVVTVDFGAPS
jgi:protein TonB